MHGHFLLSWRWGCWLANPLLNGTLSNFALQISKPRTIILVIDCLCICQWVKRREAKISESRTIIVVVDWSLYLS